MEQRQPSGFLAPQHNNLSSTLSLTLSDQDTDSEDDQVLNHARTSGEIAAHDRSILEQEEEREKLLSKGRGRGLRRMLSGGLRGSDGGKVMIGHRQRGVASEESAGRRREENRDRSRESVEGELEEQGALMYEMEEGVGRSKWSDGDEASISYISSGDEEVSDRRRRMKRDGSDTHATSSTSKCTYILIFSAILVLFLILLLFAYRATLSDQPHISVPSYLRPTSNGTHLIPPTTILISLDGLRASFLNLANPKSNRRPPASLTPTLHRLIHDGLSPPFMLPSFPSVTFPNHYTLVTGLHPESHGVVSNTFYDPLLQKQFHYTDPTRSMQAEWWNAVEPLWVTAERQGKRTAVHMWPGSEAHIFPAVEPTFVDKFNESEALSKKVDRILEWLDLPFDRDDDDRESKRPQLIAAYVPDIDVAGHKFGPNSTEILDVISSVDDMLASLLSGIEARNLTSLVNIVVVSDHGMATTSVERLIQFEDIIDPSLISHTDGWPLYGLRLYNSRELMPLHIHLLAQTKNNTEGNYKVYLRDSTMPERYHFSENPRIAPLWLVPETGWAIVKKDQFDVAKARETGTVYRPQGLHGYDNQHPLMRAIFIARGPAFAHMDNKHYNRLDVFQNTEVYNLVCESLGIKPEVNNGTLHLPLKAIGTHPPPTLAIPPPPMAPAPNSPAVSSPTTAAFSSEKSVVLGVDVPSLTPTVTVPFSPPVSATTAPTQELGIGIDVPIPPAPTQSAGETDAELKADMTAWEHVKAKLLKLKAWLAYKLGAGPKPDGSVDDV